MPVNAKGKYYPPKKARPPKWVPPEPAAWAYGLPVPCNPYEALTKGEPWGLPLMPETEPVQQFYAAIGRLCLEEHRDGA